MDKPITANDPEVVELVRALGIDPDRTSFLQITIRAADTVELLVAQYLDPDQVEVMRKFFLKHKLESNGN